MGFIKPNNNSGGSGGGLTPQELSRLNNAYTHSKSEHAPTTAEQNVQPDWNETDTTSDAYIKNKPDLSQIGSGGNIPSVTQIEPQELDMPKVFFYGNALPATKDNVNLTMDYISNTTKFSSFVKLKCQGTSSMSYAKKNFTVAMYSDEARTTKLKKDFKGWGAQSKFCLKANYVDTTHTRNLSGARIAYDMVASRPDSTFKQQLLQCPRNGLVDGFPIKLYFNGEFYGIYTWNIPKDTWMFNMDKSNPNHIVLCAEKNTDGNSSAINSCQFRQLWTNGDGQDWSVEVGTMSEDLRTKFNRVINFVMTSTDQEFHDNIGEYFDLYSLLDYYCFSYLTCHLDGLAKNMLMVTYDGVIWGASLYDMDSIYGVSWNGGSFVSPQYQCPEQYQEQFSRLWVRIEQCFATELYARYLELRQGALSLSNIVKHVEEIYDVIPDRVFADEKAKWTSLPNVSSNTMTRFRNYMRDRAVYVDAQMQEIGTPQSSVECTGISLDKTELALGIVAGGTTSEKLSEQLTATVTPTNCTQPVVWSVEPTGIVTVNNGLVTAVANGNTTVTATCGTQSANCAVTVSGMSESGGDSGVNANLVFQVNSASMNTADNTLTDNIAGISATLTGNPTVSGNQIAFTASDTFSFNISSLNLTNSNRTFRIKFTPTTLDINAKNIIGLGSTVDWNNMTTSYIKSNAMVIQHGKTDFNNNTVGNPVGSYGNNRLTTSPVIGKKYELVISENIDGNVRYFIDGTLVQDGTTTLFDLSYLCNTEGNNRFIGSYSLIEIYNGYCNDYTEFTNMVNNASSGADTALYELPEAKTFNGTSDYIDTGVALLSTDQDFTMIMDVTANVSGNPSTCLIHCMNETPPYPGINLQASGAGGFKMNKGSNTTQIGDDSKPIVPISQRTKLVIIKNGATIKAYTSNNFKGESPYEFTAHDKTLILGAYQSASGDKGRFFKGTIHEFSITNTVYTNEQINTYLGVDVITE